jgi:hypothetical protein
MLQHKTHHNLMKDWDGNGKLVADWPVPLVVNYEDPDGEKYEATMTMVYHPIAEIMNRKINPNFPRQPDVVLEFTNLKFSKRQ